MNDSLGFTGPIDAANGSGGQYSLDNAARIWTTLFHTLQALDAVPTKPARRSSRRVRVSFRHGPGSYPCDLISNPRFYELIMGWPIGWTRTGQPVTEFAAWLQRSRGALSELLDQEA